MASPFPQLNRPVAEECRAVCHALAQLHGEPNRTAPRVGCEIQEPHTVLDSLVRTILSQNTTDITSQRAFTSLKAAFPDWDHVRTAAPGAVEEAIRVGGLADIKAARIKAILNSLLSETGSLSLEHLRQLPVEDIKQQLRQYKGVGPKTIACVLMFCMGRAEFPVDTHVWEISKQLGWVPPAASREQTYEHLNSRVPDDIKYDLHVLMVQHGKKCAACGKRGAPQKRKVAAAAEPCPLAAFKRSKGSSGSGASSSAACKEAAAAGDVDVDVGKQLDQGLDRQQAPAGAAGASAAAAAAAGTGAAAGGNCSRKRAKQPKVKLEEPLVDGLCQQAAAAACTAAIPAVAVKLEVQQQQQQQQGVAAAVAKQEDLQQQPLVKQGQPSPVALTRPGSDVAQQQQQGEGQGHREQRHVVRRSRRRQ